MHKTDFRKKFSKIFWMIFSKNPMKFGDFFEKRSQNQGEIWFLVFWFLVYLTRFVISGNRAFQNTKNYCLTPKTREVSVRNVSLTPERKVWVSRSSFKGNSHSKTIGGVPERNPSGEQKTIHEPPRNQRAS